MAAQGHILLFDNDVLLSMHRPRFTENKCAYYDILLNLSYMCCFIFTCQTKFFIFILPTTTLQQVGNFDFFRLYKRLVATIHFIKTTVMPLCLPTFLNSKQIAALNLSQIFEFLGWKSLCTLFIFIRTIFIFVVFLTAFRPWCPSHFLRCISIWVSYKDFRTESFILSTGVKCPRSTDNV